MNTSTSGASWEKLPGRIEPIVHFRQLIKWIPALAWLSSFWISLSIFFYYLFNSDWPFVLKAIMIAFSAVGLVILIIFSIWLIKSQIFRGRQFQQNQSQIIAQILHRRIVENNDRYADSKFTYQLQLEFTPTANMINGGSVKYEVEISEKLYKILLSTRSVNITYDTQDPRIFIIEGE